MARGAGCPSHVTLRTDAALTVKRQLWRSTRLGVSTPIRIGGSLEERKAALRRVKKPGKGVQFSPSVFPDALGHQGCAPPVMMQAWREG